MSGHVAVLQLDGREASSRDVARMSRASPASTGWTAAVARGPFAAALVGSSTSGGIASDVRYTVLIDGRLCDRAGLAAALRIGPAEARAVGDADLVLEAWTRWGVDASTRLLGEHVLIVWDAKDRALHCVRDATGARTLVYARTTGAFVCASHVESLVANVLVSRAPDEGRIADFLVPELESADPRATFFASVRKVPAGHLLVVRDEPVERRWWSLRPAQVARGEGLAALEDAVRQAIAWRLDGCDSASMLSGGVDSSAVVAFARDHRAGRGESPLATYSAIGDPSEPCDDAPHVHSMRAAGGIDARVLTPSRMGDLARDAGRCLSRTADPFDLVVVGIPTVMYAAAACDGHDVLLDGVDGDVAFCQGPNVVRHAWREQGPRAAYATARAIHKAFGYATPTDVFIERGVITAAWQDFVMPRASVAARAVVQESRAASRALAWTRRSPIARDFARAANVVGRSIRMAAARRPSDGPGFDALDEYVANATADFVGVALDRYARAASWSGVRASHPLLDARVLAVAASLDWRERTRDGWPKWALRRIVDGRVPQSVQWRVRGRTAHGSFLRALLDAHRPWIDDIARSSSSGLARYVDGALLERTARRRAAGDLRAAWDVARVAVLGGWLSREGWSAGASVDTPSSD